MCEVKPTNSAPSLCVNMCSVTLLQVKDLQEQSSNWAAAAGNYITQLEDYQRHVTKLIGPRTKVRPCLSNNAPCFPDFVQAGWLAGSLWTAPDMLNMLVSPCVV